EPLVDDSLLMVFRGSDSATDRLARAARCALAIRGRLTGVPLALATGRTQQAGRRHAGSVIDRAAQLHGLARPSVGVRVDPLTAGLLATRFGAEKDVHGWVLTGELPASDAPPTLLGKPTPCV